MRPHPRARKSAKWLLTTLALSITTVTIASYWYGASIDYSDASDGVIGSAGISHGVLRWSRYWSDTYTSTRISWGYGRITTPRSPWTWRIYTPGPIGTHITLPLHIPAALTLLPAILLWRRDLQMTARAKVGHCPICGYDRKGLATNSKCPECGRSVHRAAC